MIPVGHRALVAIERADGRYDCHYAHEGAHEWGLLAAITAAGDGRGPPDPRAIPGVDSAPLVTDVSFETVTDTHLDFCTYEACYRLDNDGTVAPALVCWFGFPATGEYCPGAGALIGVDPDDARADGRYVRGWFEGTKGALAAGLDAGWLSADEARTHLRSRIEDWAGDRWVAFGPGVEGERAA